MASCAAFFEQTSALSILPPLSMEQEKLMVAQGSTGLKFQLTGILGKRTKFQSFETPQLVLDASSRQQGAQRLSPSQGSCMFTR